MNKDLIAEDLIQAQGSSTYYFPDINSPKYVFGTANELQKEKCFGMGT